MRWQTRSRSIRKPTCTKCRETISILKQRGVELDSVNYYETRLTEAELRPRAQAWLIPASCFARGKRLSRAQSRKARLTDDELIALMVENPDLMQRPIVVRGKKAVLGRPPESVEDLI